MVLNEAPNNNDTMHVVNDMHLPTIGTQQFSMVAIIIASIMQKSYLTRDER